MSEILKITGSDCAVKNEIEKDCLGGVIKTARQANGFTQAQLAERLGITARYLIAIAKSISHVSGCAMMSRIWK
jgi:ribosome-binding protein aMBF1 (putative translation factor)